MQAVGASGAVTRPDLSQEAEHASVQLRKPYQLYLLECADGTLYAGVALDVVERFIKHLLGLGAAYTRSHPPLRVLACRQYPSKGHALSAEYALKQLPRQDKPGFFEAHERLADAALPALRDFKAVRADR